MANNNRPTRRQLAYLRGLAKRTGTTFSYPHSKGQASKEIKRLQAIANTGMTFAELAAERDEREAAWDEQLPLELATAIHDTEISGYGASCHWA